MQPDPTATPAQWRGRGEERRAHPVLATLVVVGLAILAPAFAVRQALRAETSPYVGLLLVAAAAGFVLLLAVAIPWHPRPRPQWRAVDGGVRFVSGSRLSLLLLALPVTGSVLVIAGGVVAIDPGHGAALPWWGLVALGVPMLLGWGILLARETRSVVVLSRRGIDLEDLSGVVLEEGGEIVEGHRSFALSWVRLEHLVPAEGGAVVLEAGRTSVAFHPSDFTAHPARMLRFLQHYLAHPEDRDELGTPRARARWRVGCEA